jgi:FixJ family two-component response regulator
MKNKMVVVVEDDKMVNDIVVTALEEFGFTVIAFRNADHPMRAVPPDMPAVLVADIMLPGSRSGLALAEEWERAGPLRRVVMMTGSIEVTETKHPLLIKPFGISSLTAMVQACFDGMPGSTAEPGTG